MRRQTLFDPRKSKGRKHTISSTKNGEEKRQICKVSNRFCRFESWQRAW